MVGSSNVKLLADDGKRLDGRAMDELREIKIQPGILNRVDGSAYVEWGKNKILAAVYGPRECIPRHNSDPYKAIVRCRYLMAPFSSLEEHGRSGPNRRSMEISDVIKEVFENVILTENYPKTAIDIFIEVLEGNGSTRCVGLTAAAVALVTAGLPIKDIPLAVSVGKINGRIAVDMMKEEDNFGEADLAVAIRPGNKEILLLQMDGKLTRAELEESFDLVFKAAEQIHELQVNSLKEMYEKIGLEVESEGDGNEGNVDNGNSGSSNSREYSSVPSTPKVLEQSEFVAEIESGKEIKDLSDSTTDESEPHEIQSEEEDLKDISE